MSEEWITLLSKKPMCDFTPAEYKEYIRTLYLKRPPKKSAKAIKIKRAFSWLVNKKGTLSIKVNRTPKTLTHAEVDLIAKESGKDPREVWLKVMRPKSGITVVRAEAQQSIMDIPI